MKFFGLLLTMCIGLTAFSQNAANLQTAQDYTPNEKANFAAGELIKHLNIDNKAEYGEVLKACNEYYIACSIDDINNNPEALAEVKAELDKSIKKIIGANRMEAFNNWKQKEKFYEPVDYAHD